MFKSNNCVGGVVLNMVHIGGMIHQIDRYIYTFYRHLFGTQ